MAINFFFDTGNMKILTNYVSHTQQEKCVSYRTLNFKNLYIFGSWTCKRKKLLRQIQLWGKYTLSIRNSKLSIKWYHLAQDRFKVAKILTIVNYPTNFSNTNNSKFTDTLGNIITCRTVIIHKSYLYQLFLNNSTVAGSQGSFPKRCMWDTNQTFSP